jgi:t-SNARE complex subunit (syntaxin)
LGWAIAVLLLCFFPTGIAAVVYSTQVDSKLAYGDIAGAWESSRKAKMWCWISFGISVAWIVVMILFLVAMGVATGFGDSGF